MTIPASVYAQTEAGNQERDRRKAGIARSTVTTYATIKVDTKKPTSNGGVTTEAIIEENSAPTAGATRKATVIRLDMPTSNYK
jgi:hypothetical protein